MATMAKRCAAAILAIKPVLNAEEKLGGMETGDAFPPPSNSFLGREGG